MSMTAEEKAAFDAAHERVKSLETELRSEWAASARLEAELQAAADRAKVAEGGLIEFAVDKLVGTKLAPAERDEYVQLAKDIGLERVTKILAARPDLKLLETVKVNGKPVSNNEQPAAPPAEGSDGSADIVKAALAAIGPAQQASERQNEQWLFDLILIFSVHLSSRARLKLAKPWQ